MRSQKANSFRRMRKPIFVFIIFGLCLILFAQEITHETIVVNIEVPVRVFKGDKFVDNLTINDFEVYEDGKLQEIVAVYLIKKAVIERKEEAAKEKFTPDVSRNFIFVFEIRDYLQKIDEVLDYFFNNILLPEDTFKVVTPVKTYGIKKSAFESLSKQEISNQLKGILRKDVYMGSADYRSFCADLEKVLNTEGIEGGLEYLMSMEILRKLKELSYFNESKLLELSDKLKQTEGQKHIFLFYQKEILPIPTFLGPEERIQ